jgi:hypothetical protein
MAAAKRKEKKPIKTGISSGHITNLKQCVLETFDIYDWTPIQENNCLKLPQMYN